ncbi:MAG: hypothetical protein ACM3Q1_06125 [Bacteroidales bacterium]
MTFARSSTLAILLALGLAACAETRVTDRAATQATIPAKLAGKTLLVVETALPADTPEREARAAEAVALVRQHLAPVTGGEAAPASDEALAAQARAQGLDSVSVVRVEDYARRGNLYVAIALPPVAWDTRTEVTLRLRVVDARTGATLTDLRRDRVRGGLFTLRKAEDLPAELTETLNSLLPAG